MDDDFFDPMDCSDGDSFQPLNHHSNASHPEGPTDAAPTGTPSPILGKLPGELFQDVLNSLDPADLVNLSCTSKWYYHAATPIIWRDLHLVDRCQPAPPALDVTTVGPNNERVPEFVPDQHDDEVWLRKLLLLISKPWIAASVRSVTHRCHLPPPAIFEELPVTPLAGYTLSPDPRTTKIVELAVRLMTNVTTLRIIFGHPSVNDALLRCFFDQSRLRNVPVRRLWLECCRISAGCDLALVDHILDLPAFLDFSGLQSIRIRRLPLRPGLPANVPTVVNDHFNHARGMHPVGLQNGLGGIHLATIHNSAVETMPSGTDTEERHLMSRETGWQIARSEHQIFQHANLWDDLMYERLERSMGLPEEVRKWHISSHRERSQIAWRGRWLDPVAIRFTKEMKRFNIHAQRERRPSAQVALNMLYSASDTLTSLCLDWIFTSPHGGHTNTHRSSPQACDLFWTEFFVLRFPHLRAFQLRNSAHPSTRLPKGLYLFDLSTVSAQWITMGDESMKFQSQLAPLDFMEYHDNLVCLAWPMDGFFSDSRPPPEVVARVDVVLARLGMTLVDLRVDSTYKGVEIQSDSDGRRPGGSRRRRHRFIEEFAPRMQRLESIKIEGSMPRDERREVIRALYKCPLQKIVMIGLHWPLGNTWGPNGKDIKEFLGREQNVFIEGEHKEVIHKLGYERLEPSIPENFRFRAYYGWPPSPPMIHTVASLFASTITELKFCGYRGAPLLYSPTPITHPMLAALKHFKNLETLTLSFRLNTLFEGSHHDGEIIKYWIDSRSPQSTALVPVTNNNEAEEENTWAKELQTKFSPEILAYNLTAFIGPFLHPDAKLRQGRGGGVRVRASFCLANWTAVVFDFDIVIASELRMGQDGKVIVLDRCLGFMGPREELEPNRRKGKLADRRWF